jgi:hypothetical protein
MLQEFAETAGDIASGRESSLSSLKTALRIASGLPKPPEASLRQDAGLRLGFQSHSVKAMTNDLQIISWIYETLAQNLLRRGFSRDGWGGRGQGNGFRALLLLTLVLACPL